MKHILDEQLREEDKEQKPVPRIIYLFMTSLVIYLLVFFLGIQQLFYSNLLQLSFLIAVIATTITGLFSIKIFYVKKDILLMCFSFLFLIGVGIRSIAHFAHSLFNQLPNRHFLAELFSISAVLMLMRYFILHKGQGAFFNMIKYFLFLVLPTWIIGLLFKMQSWPYATEILTASVLLFLLGAIGFSIFKLKKERATLGKLNVGLVLVVIILAFGVLLKVQNVDYVSESVISTFFSIELDRNE